MQRAPLASSSVVVLFGLSMLAAACADRDGLGLSDGGSPGAAGTGTTTGSGTGSAGTGAAGTGTTTGSGTGTAGTTGAAGTGTSTGTAGTTGAAGTGMSTGTAGATGAAGTGGLMCPPVCAIFCEYGNVTDAKGCPTCKCNPAPVCKPTDCSTATAPGGGAGAPLLPVPVCSNGMTVPAQTCSRDASTGKCVWTPGKCPVCPAIACANKCAYGQKVGPDGCATCECNPPPAACTKEECGALPPFDPGICPNGLVAPPPVCSRNAGGMCSWTFSKCAPVVCPAIACLRACPNGSRPDANGCPTCDCIEPQTCAALGDWKSCTGDMRCTWLQPGCGTPALATPGCFARTDVGCQGDGTCANGRTCLKRSVNPCFNPAGGAACDACGAIQTVCL